MFLFLIFFVKKELYGHNLLVQGDSWLEESDFDDIDRSKVVNLYIRDGIIIIKDHTFKGFDNLQKITLPATLEHYDPTALDDCPNLQDVRYNGDERDSNEDPHIEQVVPAIPLVPWTIVIVLIVICVFSISYFGDEMRAKDEIIAELRNREISADSVDTKHADELIQILKTLEADDYAINLAESIRARLARIEE